MLFFILKVACGAIYVTALAGHAGLLPDAIANPAQILAGSLLVVHALELIFVMKHVRRYPGALAVSVILTLLFGLLHWKPIADQRRA